LSSWRKAAISLVFADTPFAFVVLRAAEDSEVAVVGCGQGLVVTRARCSNRKDTGGP